MPSRCIQCEYPRAGLEVDTPCPECGAAHDADTFLVRGGSGPGNGAWGMVLGTLLVAGSVILQSAMGPAAGCIAGAGVVLGLLMAGVGLLQRVQAGGAGDVAWAFLPEGIEVRMRGVATRIPWRLLDELRLRDGWRGWQRVQARSSALFLGGHPAIWLRDRAIIERMLEVADRRRASR